MGIRFKEPSDAAASASAAAASPALREALLFITMSIIGLPVEVHIKDGSVYSGIFHTASVEMGYGVVLKKARMIKKGTHAAKGVNRSLIDTLVVLPENLVQVFVKNVMVSANGVSGAVALDEIGAVTSDVKSVEGSEKEASHANSQLDEHAKNWQDSVHRAQEEGACNDKSSFHKEEQVHKVQASSASSEGPHLQVKTRNENKKVTPEQQLGGTTGENASKDLHDSRQSQRASSSVNTAASSTPDRACFSSGATTRVVPLPSSVVNRNARESRLNPGAKIFSPSFANVRPVTTPPVLPTGANVAYVPNYYHAVPLVSPQSEPGIRSIAPCPSLPMKFVTYGNLATTNTGGLQYSQPIAGPIPTRSQPIRYSSQYQPGPPYVQQFPQNGLVGGTGQLVYLNPAPHEMRPGAPPFSHAPHPQLTSHTIHIPKHEGVFTAPAPQLSVTPPLMANEQLPFGVPSHIPLPQPTFPAVRHVPVLNAGGAYGAKFL